jgi:hypothetical protein
MMKQPARLYKLLVFSRLAMLETNGISFLAVPGEACVLAVMEEADMDVAAKMGVGNKNRAQTP